MRNFDVAKGLIAVANSRGIRVRLMVGDSGVTFNGPRQPRGDKLLIAMEEEATSLIHYLRWQKDKLGDQTSIDDLLDEVVVG